MNTNTVENEIMTTIHGLPLNKLQSILDFSLFIKFNALKENQAQDSEEKLIALRSALIAGENSGKVENYSLAGLLAELDNEELA